MSFEFDNRLDTEFLQSIYGDDLEYAAEVFSGFLSETRPEFNKIKASYAENDIKTMRQKLHKIKPTFSFVGLSPITESTEKIIRICDRSVNVSETEPGCAELFRSIENAFTIVESETERLKKLLV